MVEYLLSLKGQTWQEVESTLVGSETLNKISSQLYLLTLTLSACLFRSSIVFIIVTGSTRTSLAECAFATSCHTAAMSRTVKTQSAPSQIETKLPPKFSSTRPGPSVLLPLSEGWQPSQIVRDIPNWVNLICPAWDCYSTYPSRPYWLCTSLINSSVFTMST